MIKRFISDLHFSHNNVLRFTPEANEEWRKNGYTIKEELFKSIEERDDYIVEKWNSVVKEDDTTYILGDLILGNIDLAFNNIKRLNGNKILVSGNHDFKLLNNPEFLTLLGSCGFNKIYDSYYELRNDDSIIVLCHYPIFSFNGNNRNSVHLYGHIHNIYSQNIIYYNAIKDMVINRDISLREKAYNVGCMCPWINYLPKTVEEIEKDFDSFMEKKSNEEIYDC